VLRNGEGHSFEGGSVQGRQKCYTPLFRVPVGAEELARVGAKSGRRGVGNLRVASAGRALPWRARLAGGQTRNSIVRVLAVRAHRDEHTLGRDSLRIIFSDVGHFAVIEPEEGINVRK
jgi:hypothetical protein